MVLSIQQALSKCRRGSKWQHLEARVREESTGDQCQPPHWESPSLADTLQGSCLSARPSVLVRMLTPFKEATDTPATGSQAFWAESCEVASEVLPLQPDTVSLGCRRRLAEDSMCWDKKGSF